MRAMLLRAIHFHRGRMEYNSLTDAKCILGDNRRRLSRAGVSRGAQDTKLIWGARDFCKGWRVFTVGPTVRRLCCSSFSVVRFWLWIIGYLASDNGCRRSARPRSMSDRKCNRSQRERGQSTEFSREGRAHQDVLWPGLVSEAKPWWTAVGRRKLHATCFLVQKVP